MKGWSTRDPRYLCPCLRREVELIRTQFRVRTGTELQVIETARDLVRQREYVRIGVSQTLDSKHVVQEPGHTEPEDARLLACDMAPAVVLTLPKWDPDNELWAVYGELALARGVLWGGLWGDEDDVAPYTGWDKPHVYLETCRCLGEDAVPRIKIREDATDEQLRGSLKMSWPSLPLSVKSEVLTRYPGLVEEDESPRRAFHGERLERDTAQVRREAQDVVEGRTFPILPDDEP